MKTILSSPSRPFVEPLESRIAPAVAVVDLGAIDGVNGFKVNGVANDDAAGVSVSLAGDVNGDGRVDLLIGANAADPGGRGGAGTAYVVFGRATPFPASFNLSSLDGTNGFAITGEAIGDGAGLSVTRAGDLNGDGIGDLVIGAPGADPGGRTNAGAAYVVYGKRTSFTATVDLSSASVTEIRGEAAGDGFGSSVALAGDVNGDGRQDVIIGAPGAGSFAGASYVIFGRTGTVGSTSAGAVLDLGVANSLTGRGVRIAGEAADDQFGYSVGGAVDVNGDGLSDVVIGAPFAGANDNGAAYVVYGRRLFTPTVALTSLTGTNGFKMSGELADDGFGWSVAGLGDVNGDLLGDIAVGARNADRNALIDNGAAYVVFGKRTSFGASFDLTTLNGTNGFEVAGLSAGAQLGSSVSRAGDLNRDGFGDILFGASASTQNAENQAGAAFALFGARSGFAANVNLATLNGFDGFRINGDVAGDSAGFSVAAAGDVNRDGYADILVGAPRLDGAAGPGAAYVIYGRAARIAADGLSAVVTDVDGDTVVVRVSKGRLGVDDFLFDPVTGGLQRINLGDDGTEFQGASLSITAATPTGRGGNGLVNVGAIDAAGVDLVNVVVRGDLGQIDAGDANTSTTGLSHLSVRSLGAVSGTQPVGTTNPLVSAIAGRLGTLSVAGNVLGTVEVNGTVGGVAIGGNLDGSAGGTTAGLIRATGSIGNVTVTGDVIGGADFSGLVADGRIGLVNVRDFRSADANNPVLLHADGLPAPATPLSPVVAIAGFTARNVENAQILADTTISNSQLNSNMAIGNVVARGNWTNSLLQSTGNIGNITIVGNLEGTNQLGIFAGRRMGHFSVFGDVLSQNSGTPLLITAAGDNAGGVAANKTAAGNLAFASITIGRLTDGTANVSDVTNTFFLAGYGRTVGGSIGPVNGDASTGAVFIEGSFNASSIVAGVQDSGNGFGLSDQLITSSNNPSLVARIASVVIRGAVTNNSIVGSHFGITAQQIGAAVISGVPRTLTTGTDGPIALGTTGDITLVEVAPVLPT